MGYKGGRHSFVSYWLEDNLVEMSMLGFCFFFFSSLLAVEQCESASERKYLLALSFLASMQYFLPW